MPWNEPGGNGKNNDPWSPKKEQGPPALDKVFANLLNSLGRLFQSGKKKGPWQPSGQQEMGWIVGVVCAVLLILWFVSGLFIVNPAEEAVILRFGKYSHVVHPGLHWTARFIDTKYMVDVRKIYAFSLQGDFLTKSSEQGDAPKTDALIETKKALYALDQSKNLVNVELNVQYRIRNPRAYLFNVVDPDATVKAVASGALSDVVGQMKLDEVLTTGRETLSSGVLQRIKQVIEPYQTGLEIINVNLRKVQAPDQVRVAFNDVNRADQDKATTIQQAQAYASKVVPLAQGVSARILADAMAYQQQAFLTAQANVQKYQALLKVYATAPDITRQRMYIETMQKIFQNTTKVLVDVNTANNLIYLPLDKWMKQQEPSSPLSSSQTMPSLSYGQNDVTSNNGNQAMTEEMKNDTN